VIRHFPRAALAAPLFAFLLGCPSSPKRVAYDLAERTGVAERWSAREVLLFGTPGAGPQEVEGFYREAGGTGETFLWAKGEAEIAFQWREAFPRVAILDIAPYRGLKAQSAEVRLNGKPVGQLTLNDERYRYRVALPAEAQRLGENRLGFLFAATGSPSASDPKNADQRQLAAAFYSLTVGRAGDAALEDLMGRDAPRPFSVTEVQGALSLTLVGPSLIRFALRLPPAAELRFTPDLHPGARAAAGAASFKVTFEDPEQGGKEEVIWSRVISARDPKGGEVVVSLPGTEGDIVRLGLQVGPAPAERFTWGVWGAPRVLGRGEADPRSAKPPSREEGGRGDALRGSLAGRNVLLVILDAARAREFGAYGYPRPTTPEIDRIASEGTVFENAFTPAAYTLGAMASVWTSQYPDRHHSEVSFSARLPRDRLTLAELLSAQGIFTAGFVANAVAGAAFGFDRGFSEFHEVFRDLGSGAEVFRRAVPPFLAAHRGSRFFAYLHFREPHFPYDPPPPFDTRFGSEGPIPHQVRRDIRWITDINQGRRGLAPEERHHLVRLYDGNLAFADQEVGALRKALEAEGLWERTVVIVAADHGEGLWEHGWIGHNVQVYDESVRVPLIVRFPGGRDLHGRRIPAFVDLLDLAPTIADLFGVLGRGGSEQAFQGRSLLPVLEGAPGKPLVLSRSVWDRPRYALRDPRFAFLYDTRSGEEALYEREADPGETRDIGAEQPVRAAYYRQELHHWIVRLGQRRAAGAEAVKPTREQCDNLNSIGYVPPECK
jgi:arylsulfatase A-like enzyme